VNWEGFFVIGLFTLVLGALLYIPARLWAKRKSREHPDSNAALRLTKSGFVFFGLFTVALIVALSWEFLAPESRLGQLAKTSLGRFGIAVVVGLVFWLLEVGLNSKGVRLLDKKESRNV
jgi:hypothetical protein